jgi:hypothetical protein
VFERVQADYRARLERVNEQIASHRHAIDDERGKLRARCSELRTGETTRRDERAELELRAHVGELTGADAEGAFGEVDHAIGILVEERKGLEVRIAELSELLGEKGIAPPEPTAGPGSEAQATEAAAAVDAAVAKEASREATAPAAEVLVAVAQAVEPAPAPTAPAAPASAAPTAAPPVTATNGGAPAQQESGARARGGRASFDELAFLSSVVGKNDPNANATKKEAAAAPAAAAPIVGPSVAPAIAPAIAPKPEAPLVERRSTEPLIKAPAGIVQEENAATESLLAGLENAKMAPGHHPLAANVASNTPIVLRPSTTLEQAKTLKCNECGGLNYPTEWYCERCGAELAAL